MKKRLFAALLAVCLTVSLIPTSVFAEGTGVPSVESTVTAVECDGTEECKADTHAETCALYVAPECTATAGCTLAAGHEGDCVLPKVCAVDCTLKGTEHEECVLPEDCLTEGCLLKCGHEGEHEYITGVQNLNEGNNAPAAQAEGGVAQIGEQTYATLADAILDAPNGTATEIKLIDNAVGGIIVPAGKNIVIDLNNHEIDVKKAVGSTGTETNGLQLLKGSTITIKNGVIRASVNTVKIMIKNYANLTLENVDVRGSVNNCGQLIVNGENTKIVVDDSTDWAICTGNYHKGDIIRTEINAGNITSVAIETPLWETGGATVDESVTTVINGGTIGKIGTYDWRAEYGGNYLNAPLLKNWQFIVKGGTIGTIDFAAKIGNNYYATLADAVASAQDGETVVVLKDADLGDSMLTVDKAITVDGGSEKHSITSTAINVVRILSNGDAISGTVKFSNLKICATNTNKSGRAIGIGNSTPITGLNLVIENCVIETTQRGITVNPDNNSGINLTVKDSTISLMNGITNYDEEVNPTNDYNSSRGISLWRMGNSKVSLENSTVQGFYYSINNAGSMADELEVIIDNCTLKCRAGINAHNPGTKWILNNSKVHGINNFGGQYEAFANIVLNQYTINNIVKITDCKFTTFFNDTGKNNENAIQSFVCDRGTDNTINVFGNTTYQIYDLAKGGTDYYPSDFAEKYECVDAGLGNGTFKILLHEVVSVSEKSATCVADGIKAHYECESCGRLYSDAEGTTEITADSIKTAATGNHSFGEWQIDKNPTCVAEGQYKATCGECGYTKYDAIAASGKHSYGADGKCTVCGNFDATKVTATPVATPEPTTTPAPVENIKPAEANTTVVEIKASEEVSEIVKNNVEVTEGAAVIEKDVIDSVITATKEDETVVLPVAEAAKENEAVNEIVLTEETVRTIAEKDSDVVINFSDATIMLDKEAVSAVREQAKGKDIEIRAVKVETSVLTAAQQTAIGEKESAIVVTAQIFADGEYIGDFNGGTATIMLPLEVEEGRAPEDYKVYYIAEDGTLEEIAAEYVDGFMVFTTGHFSDYAIVYEKAVVIGGEVVTTPETTTETNTSLPIIPIIVIAIVAFAGIFLIIKKKKEA
ncbi:MAG: hypothetical protein PUB11_06085 [Oscillospiraceae bacterium]|nr:hypothetical protein [Oscillospiraceae bacterium]